MRRWMWALVAAAVACQARPEVCSMARPRHTLTADTFFLLRLDEAVLDGSPLALDEAGNLEVTDYGPTTEVADPLVDEGGKARFWPNITDVDPGRIQAFAVDDPQAEELLAIFRGEFTLECYLALGYGWTEPPLEWDAPYRALIHINGSSDTGDPYPENGFLVALTLAGEVVVSYGTGGTSLATLISPAIVDPNSIAPFHFGLVKRMAGVNTVFDVYLDDVLRWTSAPAVNWGPIALDPPSIEIGSWASGYFTGTIDDIRLRSSVVDPPPVAAQYWPPPAWQQANLVDPGTAELFAQYWPPPPWLQANTVNPSPYPPHVPFVDNTPARASGDVRLVWANGTIDASIEGDDVAADLGLQTAMLLSLFTDRRAEADDKLPSEDGDRRGWWGDEFAAVEGDRSGSRLWLLDRSKRTSDVVPLAKEYATEALAWVLEDHVAERLDIEAELIENGYAILVTLHRPGRSPVTFRFQHVWDGEAAR